jgi:hypothetical protein
MEKGEMEEITFHYEIEFLPSYIEKEVILETLKA